jgi:REP element-mobilizing transposase RayT
MPDHVHFFCSPIQEASSLSTFVGKWKEWTAKLGHRQLGMPRLLWQAEFFDHVLRSEENYEEKWNYVRNNPVRAGLVESGENWPYQG